MRTPLRQPGLTLVELLAALAVTGMIVAVIATTLLYLPRAQRAALAQQEQSALAAPLRQVIETDLQHGTKYRPVRGGFEIVTGCTLGGAPPELQHRRSVVRYTVTVVAGTPWLVRTQQPADGRGRRDLLGREVRSIALEPLTKLEPPDREGWLALPAGVRIAMEIAPEQGGPLAFTVLPRRAP